MNRDEFLNRLSELLGDVNEAEKEEALKYYQDYFDEAGILNEQNVIKELVSPENVAETIKQSLSDEAFYDNCEYREKNVSESQLEVIDAVDSEESTAMEPEADSNQKSSKKSDGLNTAVIVLIIIAGIILSPVILSAIGAAVSTVITLIVILLVLSILIAICPFALTIGGIAAVVAGVIEFMTNASLGALIFGSGLIAIGVSLIGYVILWLYFFKLMPKFFKWLTGLGVKKGGGNK